MKRIGIIISFVLLIFLNGCQKEVDVDDNFNVSCAEETTQTPKITVTPSTENKYHWEKLEQTVKVKRSSRKIQDGKYYLLSQYYMKPLCDDDVDTIEYYLENCNGSFMDENFENPFGDNVISTPYIVPGNNQDELYFSVYFVFDHEAEITHAEEVKKANEILENMQIRLTITYNDGTIKERQIGFKNPSNYDYKLLDMYELTLPE